MWWKESIVLPKSDSHKGQNGKLLLIGGSNLFHSASLWSLTVASRIVDLVHFASIPQNNVLVQKSKEFFSNGIVVPQGDIESYIHEDDCILIGPGMMRTDDVTVSTLNYHLSTISEIGKYTHDEGVYTYVLTNYLLWKYPQKKWVIDAGALQMLDLAVIPSHAVVTPHTKEFQGLLQKSGTIKTPEDFAKKYGCIVLLKGPTDTVTDGIRIEHIKGGNSGMTKGGTGDVLAGLIASLACTNDSFISAVAGSTINKQAGDELYESVGPFFNATDLACQIPKTMKSIFY